MTILSALIMCPAYFVGFASPVTAVTVIGIGLILDVFLG